MESLDNWLLLLDNDRVLNPEWQSYRFEIKNRNQNSWYHPIYHLFFLSTIDTFFLHSDWSREGWWVNYRSWMFHRYLQKSQMVGLRDALLCIQKQPKSEISNMLSLCYFIWSVPVVYLNCTCRPNHQKYMYRHSTLLSRTRKQQTVLYQWNCLQSISHQRWIPIWKIAK